MTRGLLLILIVLKAGFLNAQEMKIGVLRAYKISDVLISYHNGSYNVYGDSLKKHTE